MDGLNRSSLWLTALVAVSLGSVDLYAQESTVYASVVSTKLFVVGAANPQTGLFSLRSSGDTTWQHTGPHNIRAFGMAVHTPSRGRLVCIASGNGVHKTTDAGTTWKITTRWEITEVLWVSIDPRTPEVMFCATPYGVYRTINGGTTWEEKTKGVQQRFTSSVVIDHSNSSTIYCSTEDGVYRSNDGAETWFRTGLNVGGVRVVVQHPKNADVLLAGTDDHGIYITRNGGKYWEKTEAGLDHSTFYSIAFDPQNPQTLYAGGYVTGVYKSTDGGVSWRRTNSGLTNLNIHSIAVDPTNGDRVFAGTQWGGVFRSDDGGSTWRSAGLSGSQVWAITVQPF